MKTAGRRAHKLVEQPLRLAILRFPRSFARLSQRYGPQRLLRSHIGSLALKLELTEGFDHKVQWILGRAGRSWVVAQPLSAARACGPLGMLICSTDRDTLSEARPTVRTSLGI